MKPARAAHRVGPRDRHGIQRIRDRLQMPLRQMQIDDRVLEFDVPEQQLHGPQVGARCHQVRGVRVPNRYGDTRFVSWARVAASRQASHTTFGVIGLSARQF